MKAIEKCLNYLQTWELNIIVKFGKSIFLLPNYLFIYLFIYYYLFFIYQYLIIKFFIFLFCKFWVSFENLNLTMTNVYCEASISNFVLKDELWITNQLNVINFGGVSPSWIKWNWEWSKQTEALLPRKHSVLILKVDRITIAIRS